MFLKIYSLLLMFLKKNLGFDRDTMYFRLNKWITMLISRTKIGFSSMIHNPLKFVSYMFWICLYRSKEEKAPLRTESWSFRIVFIICNVMNKNSVWTRVRHHVFLSEYINFDTGFLNKFCFFFKCDLSSLNVCIICSDWVCIEASRSHP